MRCWSRLLLSADAWCITATESWWLLQWLGYWGVGQGGKTGSTGQELWAIALLTRTGPLQKTAPGGRRLVLRHTWNCSAVQEEGRHVIGVTRWQLREVMSSLCWASLNAAGMRAQALKSNWGYYALPVSSPSPALTWALTYRANHSRPFPHSLLQYSPNLAFSSWSKSSLKKEQREI